MKRFTILAVLMTCFASLISAAKVNTEKTVTVNGAKRKYVLYVPDNIKASPALVFSLHGAGGHDTDRSPFRTTVADQKGCIVVYPQGVDQYFPIFGGSTPGWNATGEANEELDFFKAIIEAVASSYPIDRNRIYCCGFSNGGMMTYAIASCASDIFAACASISGFQLNEFHNRATGERPVPFLHIHGKSDDFVKYSLMPIIRDKMVARNGCNPVPTVRTVSGKYTRSTYDAMEGGAPYVYYEVEGMGHNDYTDRTVDGNSALTMWTFMSKYTLADECDKTLKWALNIDTEGWTPKQHSWKVSSDQTKFEYGVAPKANNGDNNVYPSLQFEKGDYYLTFASEGTANNKMYVKVETLDGKQTLFSQSGTVGSTVVMPFSVSQYAEYKITIVKTDAADRFTTFSIHSCEQPAEAVNSQDDLLPGEEAPQPESKGTLVELTQDQGKTLDDFARTTLEEGKDYNTYTATGDLQIAFKMVNIDVTDCDYVLVRFAEPVKAGWKLAFWQGNDLVDVPVGATEYRFDLEQSMMDSGILPQICMMTFFGGYQAPLLAKVEGVYKHSTIEEEAPKTEGTMIEVTQDQGKTLDDFARTTLDEGKDYNTYTATGDLQIAFKMVNIDVTNCDYVVVRFAEPVEAGWKLAFWQGNDLVDVPAGATEYRFDLEQSMMDSGILPQICMMTFFGGYKAPLLAKVEGVYKHSTKEEEVEPEPEPEPDPDPSEGYMIEVAQDQGKTLDDFARTPLDEGKDYNTYTATSDLQIAFKMVNIDVTNCDYVVVRFAEPVEAGWKLAFWQGNDLVDVPAGATEYRFDLEQSMMDSGILPQICMMTFFGGYQAPLLAKVEGVYKHSTQDAPTSLSAAKATDMTATPCQFYSLQGARLSALSRGVNIVRMSDGSVQKRVVR